VSGPPVSEIGEEGLLRPFEGRIPRAPVHVLYQLGLFLTALVMVLLPVCYVALAAEKSLLAAGCEGLPMAD
jgi:hypothetical protein